LFFYEGTIWYQRDFSVDKQPGRRYLVHFGAVNYRAIVYVNGIRVGEHEGGFTPFQVRYHRASAGRRQLHRGESRQPARARQRAHGEFRLVELRRHHAFRADPGFAGTLSGRLFTRPFGRRGNSGWIRLSAGGERLNLKSRAWGSPGLSPLTMGVFPVLPLRLDPRCGVRSHLSCTTCDGVSTAKWSKIRSGSGASGLQARTSC